MIEIVRSRGYLRLPEPVKLASGEWSQDFIDGKRALAEGEHLEVACRAFMELMADQGLEFDAVGGMSTGADQFAHGIGILGRRQWFFVRKDLKGRGTNRRIEGADLSAGPRVLLVDDVVTTGGSIQDAYRYATEAGASVVAAATMVDRGDAAKPWFDALGVPYFAIVTYRDLGIEPVGGGLVNA